jgi:hypothetical protein
MSPLDVRFTPESGHSRAMLGYLLSAKSSSPSAAKSRRIKGATVIIRRPESVRSCDGIPSQSPKNEGGDSD